jgi:hypothetical protein
LSAMPPRHHRHCRRHHLEETLKGAVKSCVMPVTKDHRGSSAPTRCSDAGR